MMENRVYLMDDIIIEETKKDIQEELMSRYQAYAGKNNKEGKDE